MNQLTIPGKATINVKHAFGRHADRHKPATRQRHYAGRGYTGHEHFTDFALVNMNARLFDPLVARFLCPDPLIQSPDVPQNANRYTYCFNNPLRYIDPSGMWGIDDPDDPVFLDELVCEFNVKTRVITVWIIINNTDRGDNALKHRFTNSSNTGSDNNGNEKNNLSGTGGGSGGGRTVTSSQTPPHHINPAPVSDKANRSTLDKVKDAFDYSNGIVGNAMNSQNALIGFLAKDALGDITLQAFSRIGQVSSAFGALRGLFDLYNLLNTDGPIDFTKVLIAGGDVLIGALSCLCYTNPAIAATAFVYFTIVDVYVKNQLGR